MWFVAQLVERITVEGDPQSVVHINYVLVSASDGSLALSKAHTIGKGTELNYDNPDGKAVRIRFIGVRELTRVHDAIEDGSELLYEERIGLSEQETRALTRARRQLAIFQSRKTRPPQPNYASAEVVAPVAALSAKGKPGNKKPRRAKRRR